VIKKNRIFSKKRVVLFASSSAVYKGWHNQTPREEKKRKTWLQLPSFISIIFCISIAQVWNSNVRL